MHIHVPAVGHIRTFLPGVAALSHQPDWQMPQGHCVVAIPVALWNGKTFFLSQEELASLELGLFTDASDSISWGASYAKESRWLQGCWDEETAPLLIEYKEV